MKYISNGAKLIQQQIDAGKENGTNTAVITGNYEIDCTILIPSDFHLVLDNCYLRMADNTFCNMFTNVSCRTEIGRTLQGTDRNIIIEGRGRTVLDGGEYNGLSEKNHSRDGWPHISVNNVILFTNVDGFEIKNLHIINQRWWAMNFIYCRNGKIRDIDFRSDYTRIDENGNRVPGLLNADYQSTYIKNADGIDLRQGCHDFIIENITGFCEDDSVALTGLDQSTEKMYKVEGLCKDIYNVIVRNVNTSCYCTNVRLLSQSGIKLYNVLVDGVMDSSMGSEYMDRGEGAVRIGDNHMYGDRHATADECYNITVKNVYSRGKVVLKLAGAMKDCSFENIRGFDGYGELLKNDSTFEVNL